jgi:hypothetical protein
MLLCDGKPQIRLKSTAAQRRLQNPARQPDYPLGAIIPKMVSAALLDLSDSHGTVLVKPFRRIPMKRCLVLLALAAIVPPTACLADVSCAPKSNEARILASPSPNDIHPDWAGSSKIGLSWSFVPESDDLSGKYLHGDLYSPKGGVVNEGVYILRREWDCE